MSKIKQFQLMLLAVIVLSLLFPFLGQSSTKESETEKRPDRITIQLGAKLSKNEMPAVDFKHDLHTKALDRKCEACHTEKDNAFVFRFKRTDEAPSMELYHDECIACHIEKKALDEPAGPLAEECRSCHTADKPKASSWTMIPFDKSLHYRHESSKAIKGKTAAEETNCSQCHHQANEKSKEIFYVKGEEASCAYCHKAEEKDGVRSMQWAAHDSCVKCHQTLKGKEIEAGPVSCEGCHDAAKQKDIKKLAEVPRMKRNQPDEVAIKGWKDGAMDTQNFMDAVAFNHKGHEAAVDTCKSCHHETLKKCADCHTADGGELKGGFVSVGQAMHKIDSTRSCVGCHKETTTSVDCAGCHFQMPAKKADPESCKVCHSLTAEALAAMDPAAVAKTAVENRSNTYTRVETDKIPETIEIKVLSSEYKPSVFPHRKIVQAIAKRVEKSGMAKAFHQDEAGLCMGCHHNSPKTLEPPKCASCHSKNGPSPDGRPGLKGAYHVQCITCHQKMKVEAVAPTDCVKCHEAKK